MGVPVYDSYNSFYKTPFGAVRTGETVCFRLAVGRGMFVQAPVLLWYADGCEASLQTCALHRTGSQGDSDIFEITLSWDTPGLYFYYFDLYRDYQKVFCGEWGNCILTSKTGTPYQLTVYDAAFCIPDGFSGGVMYQIFPDRFFEGHPHTTMPFADRIYRTDKQNAPYYWPNEQPEGYLNQDYFGGDLAGILQKLPYLDGLGVTCIYLNPIFEAHSNHRYNTADYLNVDPVLGTNEDFEKLCREAHRRGIRILLDGVFSHTGSDSIYFNREGRYSTRGAYHFSDSPWRSWYVFGPEYACGYRSWWGFETLPEVNEEDPSYREFICGEHGVLRTWLARGADGWRLDVADELPDAFIEDIRRAVKSEGSDKLLLGEVWEDATLKVSYGHRRHYLLGSQLDTVMNYPWRTAILSFVRRGDGEACAKALMALCDRYPEPALYTLMNPLGTHDTERAITALAGLPVEEHDRRWQNATHLTSQEYETGKKLLALAIALQFFLPGQPCVYYGDEIAMEGYRDPFNRGYFNWDNRFSALRELIRGFSARRRQIAALRTGRLTVLSYSDDTLALRRTCAGSDAVLLINRGLHTTATCDLPWGGSLQVAPLNWGFASPDESYKP